jgi:hypothetical protein
MKEHLRGSAGERFINRGDYDVSYNEGKQIIKPGKWANVVQAGMQIDVRVIMRRAKHNGRTQTCPRCPRSGLSVSAGGDWMDWKVFIRLPSNSKTECFYSFRCHGRFPVSDEDRDEEPEIVSPEVYGLFYVDSSMTHGPQPATL